MHRGLRASLKLDFMKTVTVVLNGFKRQFTLAEQIASLKNQTYPIEKIMYWNLASHGSECKVDYDLLRRESIEYAETSHDYGVWGRFTFALNASTDFICIMDDDVIPGRRYIENCINSYQQQPGIYGTFGTCFRRDGGGIHYGWRETRSHTVKQVNYLYQTWFMPRVAINAFWTEVISERLTKNRHIGEDIHLSLMAKKYLGLRSYVVPHPENNKEFWGNTAGLKYGLDEHAVHLNPELRAAMDDYFAYALHQGLEIAWDDN
jgi:cellulose synthase/poly-beta-1,6-N-acetylglucosamine synthase-like glycosyltransferase